MFIIMLSRLVFHIKHGNNPLQMTPSIVYKNDAQEAAAGDLAQGCER
jgi:hypothetical protein